MISSNYPMENTDPKISAIVVAAGLSTRMGSPKMLLKWKNSTVLEIVLTTVTESLFDEVILVYGAFREEILDIAKDFPIRAIYNPVFANGSMLNSLQTGLLAISNNPDGFMIILGDQPHLSNETIGKLAADYREQQAKLIIPSYHMRRGHPWLIKYALKNEILALKEPETLRDFLKNHENDIHYTLVDDPGILSDLDTPEDYQRLLKEEE
jgi:molybdenum cofactor cytidylyltransferase